MKVVSFDVLASLPVGTVFTKYPLGVYEMFIKGQPTTGGKFLVQHLSDTTGDGNDELFDMDVPITGGSFPIDTEIEWSDEEVDQGKQFVIYEAADVSNLIERLTKALDDATN